MLQRTQFIQYAYLMRLDRPIGILLLLWPTLWALWVAGEGMPSLHVLITFVVGVVLMRAAGCVINDFADRKIDTHVERTKSRPLAAGRVSTKEALVLFVVLCLSAFAMVLFFLNTLTIALSVVAVLLASLYPFMKRYTYLPQFVLGAAFAWAIPMAFAAELGTVPAIAWLLFLITVLWTVAYDTMYAMVDRPDDLKIGVKSTAILFGRADRLIIGVLQVLVLGLLVVVGLSLDLNIIYYFSLAVALGLAVYQQTLIYERAPQNCFKAFLNNNWFGLVIFIGMMLSYTVKG
ncbi:4-hydroxybenzoate polyprenyltransferase [hydrothermal vent metagenome]|uniref:4-hydroxybenzoate polyprenyltransferase n=1 Tax=hydrothermal vent metagenome TaxID=652676 RepID=A0A3B0YW77_9ZZZZ